jgi:hypothetical protein
MRFAGQGQSSAGCFDVVSTGNVVMLRPISDWNENPRAPSPLVIRYDYTQNEVKDRRITAPVLSRGRTTREAAKAGTHLLPLPRGAETPLVSKFLLRSRGLKQKHQKAQAMR